MQASLLRVTASLEVAGLAVAARSEERETCGRDSGENGQFQAKPKQDEGGR